MLLKEHERNEDASGCILRLTVTGDEVTKALDGKVNIDLLESVQLVRGALHRRAINATLGVDKYPSDRQSNAVRWVVLGKYKRVHWNHLFDRDDAGTVDDPLKSFGSASCKVSFRYRSRRWLCD